MKCISLTQPWASLVANGSKRIETRSWRTHYRGPLAIHAAKTYPKDCRRLALTEPFQSALAAESELPLGCVVAVCRLVDCLEISYAGLGDDPLFCQPLPPEPERSFGDYSPGRWAWLLGDVRRIEQPVPWKGALGLFEVELPEPEEWPLWTDDQVASLNAFQSCGVMHPFTCGNCSGRELVATPDGWRCDECDYRQDWAHSFMLDWSWKQMGEG